MCGDGGEKARVSETKLRKQRKEEEVKDDGDAAGDQPFVR